MNKSILPSIPVQSTGSHDKIESMICSPVEDEICGAENLSLLSQYPEVVEEIAENLIGITYPPLTDKPPDFIDDNLREAYARSTTSGAVIGKLGCTVCLSMVDCPVNDYLKRTFDEGELASEYNDILSMLKFAPIWLKSLRKEPNENLLSMNDKSQEIDIAELQSYLANIENRPLTPKSALELPSIESIRNIDTSKSIDGYHIRWIPSLDESSSDAGSRRDGEADVYDARELILGLRGFSLDKKEHDILASKLVDLITQTSKDGRPLIETPDGNITKKIKGWSGKGDLVEIRMGGKNRLYITVEPRSPDQPRTRVVILGGHGGNDTTQKAFLAHLLPPK